MISLTVGCGKMICRASSTRSCISIISAVPSFSATKRSSFKQYHAHTFARRALRSQIPGRAAADHHQIKPLRHIIAFIPLIRVNCF